MKTLIKILCLSSFLFAEDVYPYFSDPIKQLEFEKLRIYVKEVNEKELVLSGGSQFNYAYILDKTQPAIVPGNINTNYKYIYSFELIQDGKILTEIELLNFMGLTEEATKLLKNYQEILNKYNDNPYIYVNTHKPWTNFFGWLVGIPLFAGGFATFLGDWNNDLGDPAPSLLERKLLQLTIGSIGTWIIINKGMETKSVQVIGPAPNYKQSYTNEQLTSLAESYNKKIYEDIKSK